MPYAAVTDMVALFGTSEIIRLSTPDGEPLTDINAPRVTLALGNASQMIDTYLRKRYLVPVTEVLPELVRACCFMARYEMSFGEQKEPSEQARLANKETIEWLRDIRDGRNVLDGAIPSGDESYASVSDRGYVTFNDDGDATGTNCNSQAINPPGEGAWFGATDVGLGDYP